MKEILGFLFGWSMLTLLLYFMISAIVFSLLRLKHSKKTKFQLLRPGEDPFEEPLAGKPKKPFWIDSEYIQDKFIREMKERTVELDGKVINHLVKQGLSRNDLIWFAENGYRYQPGFFEVVKIPLNINMMADFIDLKDGVMDHHLQELHGEV